MKTQETIIKKPRITEKAAVSAEVSNTYVFEISPKATKQEVKKAIAQIYKVTPIKVNITKLPSKKVLVKGKQGKTKSVKKAIVYLKKSEKIDLV